VGAWLAVNGEAIYGTRPWRIFGEGPATEVTASTADAKFNEARRKELGPQDVRYTTKGPVLYALCMGWPAGDALLPALASGSAHGAGKVQRVEVLGSSDPLRFTQAVGGLRISLPSRPPTEHAVAFKVTMA
jgi:alpha-L-fucosidase